MSESKKSRIQVTKQEALDFHEFPSPGKISITPTKNLVTARDLSLAYSPGVAFPCLEIQKDPTTSYKYTSKGNMIAVISNGTAVLGLGNLGAAASKPVMEGKSVLFKRFANIDSVDIEVEEYDKDKLIDTIARIGNSWGGVNLEDIASPDCFEIERELKKKLNVPVFHDDQHGTAIICLAGLMNACEIVGKKFEDLKVVLNGPGAAGVACINLLISAGINPSNVIACDSVGVIYNGRTERMTDLKQRYAVETKARTLKEALDGADVFLGLSVKGALTKEMLKTMAKNPVIFAMANPDPEILPEEAMEARPDAIVATGRSDYPNQVNNVMGFPYIFRGALDVNATDINEEMKIAAARAIAGLAKKSVPMEVLRAYPGRRLEFGRSYIIPTPFDPRLISDVSSAVAKAAMDSGVAQKHITNFREYKTRLHSFRNPTLSTMQAVYNSLASSEKKKRIVFAEGEEIEVIKAAMSLKSEEYAEPILVGRLDKVQQAMKSANININSLEIVNAANSEHVELYIDMLFAKLARNGFLKRDCERLIKTDRNYFASAMLEAGHADSLLTGFTRGYQKSLSDISRISSKKDGEILFATSGVVVNNRTIFISDTAINENPSSENLAHIAIQTAKTVEMFGYTPRVAFVSYSNFGSRVGSDNTKIHEAIAILDKKGVSFEYDGEMMVDVALSQNPRESYPFNRLTRPANILITPNLTASHVAMNLLESANGAFVIGPILHGFEKSVQIMRYHSDINTITNLAALSLAL
ncbi:MAG: malate dehydrogenase (oxaloacetate-decarboxylating)(NADP+) [Candidatus Deianiraeaceae bacterium]|jgi:malate dehydrogenase (oxaloacetate-decarboxylating)(NADP+)